MSARSSLRQPGWKDLYIHNARLGMAPFLGGVLYTRYLEYPLALSLAGELEGKRILDIGSGRRARFPLLVYSMLTQGEVHAVDVVSYVDYHLRLAEKFHPGAARRVRFLPAQQDAADLEYPDSHFDLVFAISTIEHIPEDGDSRAMREIARVLRPAGRAIVAVPFATSGYREEFRRRDSAFGSHSKPVFFERMYDARALEQRLIASSGLELESIEYVGEPGFQFWSSFYSKLLPAPFFLQWLTMPFRILMPLFASAFLRVLDADARGILSAIFSVRRPDKEMSGLHGKIPKDTGAGVESL